MFVRRIPVVYTYVFSILYVYPFFVFVVRIILVARMVVLYMLFWRPLECDDEPPQRYVSTT